MSTPRPTTKCLRRQCRQTYAAHVGRGECPGLGGLKFKWMAARTHSRGPRRTRTPRSAALAAAIGAELKRIRLLAGLTLAEVGRRTGSDHAHICNIEHGAWLPGVEMMLDVTRACGGSFTELAALIAGADTTARAAIAALENGAAA